MVVYTSTSLRLCYERNTDSQSAEAVFAQAVCDYITKLAPGETAGFSLYLQELQRPSCILSCSLTHEPKTPLSHGSGSGTAK
jgi:acyl-CoA thioesterase FadM